MIDEEESYYSLADLMTLVSRAKRTRICEHDPVGQHGERRYYRSIDQMMFDIARGSRAYKSERDLAKKVVDTNL